MGLYVGSVSLRVSDSRLLPQPIPWALVSMGYAPSGALMLQSCRKKVDASWLHKQTSSSNVYDIAHCWVKPLLTEGFDDPVRLSTELWLIGSSRPYNKPNLLAVCARIIAVNVIRPNLQFFYCHCLFASVDVVPSKQSMSSKVCYRWAWLFDRWDFLTGLGDLISTQVIILMFICFFKNWSDYDLLGLICL